jgi:hypothetical protein
MEIKTDDYQVFYDATNTTFVCQGSLRLNGVEEYSPILDLLNDSIEKEPSKFTLDLQQLKFLNSSGISMLSQFIINVRKKKNIQMIVIGSKDVPWQGKSLKNLQRLMPSLSLEII